MKTSDFEQATISEEAAVSKKNSIALIELFLASSTVLP